MTVTLSAATGAGTRIHAWRNGTPLCANVSTPPTGLRTRATLATLAARPVCQRCAKAARALLGA